MSARLAWLDAARGLAVVAMVVFHLTWDLAHFGYIERSIPWSAPVRAFGHGIAFSFLFVAGYSLALAHRDHMRWPAFWRRFAIVAGAAALVSAGTCAAFPNAWVFFGILHVIAAASLAALPFLRAPWGMTLGAGLLALAAPSFVASSVFNSDWLMWTGLATREPMTQDWRPFFPWAGALLVGVATGRLPLSVYGERVGVRGEPHQEVSDGDSPANPERTDPLAPRPLSVSGERGLTFLGRHSLIIYLAHQPALFALFTALAFITPANNENAGFIDACENECLTRGGAQQSCHGGCVCLADEVTRNDVLAGAKDDSERDVRLEKVARRCMQN